MAAISKMALFDSIGWTPHPGQLDVLRSTCRNRVVSAGRRFGKSQIGGHELVPEALLTYGQRGQLIDTSKRREFWIVGPEYSDSEKEFRIAYNELAKMGVPFDKPGTYNNPLSGEMHISLWGGLYQVHAKSAKYPETLVGEGLSGVILAEAAKLKERVWSKYIRPTLADFRGWSLHTSTPEGKNWFYKLWQEGQDPSNPDWESWRRPSWSNPFVYPDGEADSEIEALKRDMTKETFNQEIAAYFTEFVGRVFKDFDEEIHVADLSYDPTWKTFACSDYGYTNPFVWLLIQVGPWGEVHVLDEIYQPGLAPDEAAKLVKARGLAPSSLLKFYPDPALPGESRLFSNALKVPVGGQTGGTLNARLDLIRQALRREPAHLPDDHPEKKPRLLIDRKCTNVIREMNDYRYPASAEEAAARGRNAPEVPLKKDDHTPEALGRFFAGYFGRSRSSGTRVRESVMSG